MCAGSVFCAILLVVSSLRAQTNPNATQPSTIGPTTTEGSSASTGEPPSAPTKETHDHSWHLRLGQIRFGAAYFRGPAFDPYSPYGYFPFYAAAGWEPFWGPFWSPYDSSAFNFEYDHGKGEVRLTRVPKDARVYVDGAYAGVADDLKRIWLDPGAYDLAIEVPGHDPFPQRIYVLSGKTLKIFANQAPNPSGKEKP